MKKRETEFTSLHEGLEQMGLLASKMVRAAVDAISADDRDELTSMVNQWEVSLDGQELELHRKAVRMLTVYGPVAHDLRFVITATRVTSELERVGDHAMNVCESTKLLSEKEAVSKELQQMGQIVCQMLEDTLAAVHCRDAAKAREIIALDDEIDQLNRQIVAHQLDSKASLSGTLGQVLIARSLERIGDQCTNICEELVYAEQGDDIRHPSLSLPVVPAVTASSPIAVS